MKILHCPAPVGGHAQQLAASERIYGLESKSIIFQQTYFLYRADKVLISQGASRIFLELSRWRLLLKALSYDVIHYNFGQSIMPNAIHFCDPRLKKKSMPYRLMAHIYTHALEMLDVRIFKMLGKKIYVTYQGDDIRQGDYCLQHFEITYANQVDDIYYNKYSDALKRKRAKKFSKHANKIFALNPDLLHLFSSQAEFCPYAHIDLLDWTPPESRLKKTRPLVIHAPTNRSVKGTNYIIDAVDNLRKKGLEFDFILIENLSNAEAKKLYLEADLLIDQLLAGWYGGLAVELMALGVPVVAYIRQNDLQFIPAEMQKDLPIINATPNTIENVLDFWLTKNRPCLDDLGKKSRNYVERWHDPNIVAKRMYLEYCENG